MNSINLQWPVFALRAPAHPIQSLAGHRMDPDMSGLFVVV